MIFFLVDIFDRRDIMPPPLRSKLVLRNSIQLQLEYRDILFWVKMFDSRHMASPFVQSLFFK